MHKKLPSVFTMEEVSNEAREPAKALQDGVWLEFPPPALSVVVKVLSDGPLLKIACAWWLLPPPSTDAADPDLILPVPVWLVCLCTGQLTPADETEWWDTVSLKASWSLGEPPLEMELPVPVRRPPLRWLWGGLFEAVFEFGQACILVELSTSKSRDRCCLERLLLEVATT